MTNHANRGAGHGRNPKPAEIRELREQAGLTQAGFGALVHTTWRVVMQWEAEPGDPKHRRCHPAFWELAQRKLGVWKDPK